MRTPGNKGARTPSLDRIAQEGMLLAIFYVSAYKTVFTRASLILALYIWRLACESRSVLACTCWCVHVSVSYAYVHVWRRFAHVALCAHMPTDVGVATTLCTNTSP